MGKTVEPEVTQQHTDQADAAMQAAAQLEEASVYVSLHLTKVGLKKNVDPSEVMDPSSTTEAGMLHVTKDIFDSRELRGVNRAQNAAHQWLLKNAYRTKFREGVHRLPVAMIPRMLAYFEKQQEQLDAAVAELAGKIDEIKEKAKTRLGLLYDETDYPTPEKLKAAFAIQYSFLSVGVPTALAELDDKLYLAERQKARARVVEEQGIVVQALREQVAQTVQYMADLLKDSARGRAKGFHASSVEAVREFFDVFSAKNIGGDTSMDPVIARARQLLDGVTAGAIKDDHAYRRQLQGEFEKVQQTLSTLVTLKPARSIRLAE